jgi:nucleoside-diphosphate-sugar epimerase
VLYNIVDDEPAAMRDLVPYLAEIVGAPAPTTIPASTAARAAGEQVVYYGTQLRGASNAKARRGLGFEPRYRTWREGFRATFGPAAET